MRLSKEDLAARLASGHEVHYVICIDPPAGAWIDAWFDSFEDAWEHANKARISEPHLAFEAHNLLTENSFI